MFSSLKGGSYENDNLVQLFVCVHMQSKIHLLNEIVVRPSVKKKYKTIGYAKSKKDIRITSSSGMEYVVFVTNDYRKELLIKSVLLNMVQRKDITSVIRIHLYSCNDMVTPGKELIHDNLLVYLTKKNDRLIKVDISKYYIKIPESGIFVGMEWIGILDEDTGIINDTNGFEMESFIFFTLQATQQQTYMRSLKYNWEWDDRMFKELPPYNEKASINAAFGLKVQIE